MTEYFCSILINSFEQILNASYVVGATFRRHSMGSQLAWNLHHNLGKAGNKHGTTLFQIGKSYKENKRVGHDSVLGGKLDWLVMG